MLPDFGTDESLVSLEERLEISRAISPTAALVYEILAQHAEIAHSDVATMLGIGKNTVRRAIKALSDAGLLKIEHQIVGSRQKVNRYHQPTSVPGPRLGAQNGHALSTGEEVLREEIPEEVHPGERTVPEEEPEESVLSTRPEPAAPGGPGTDDPRWSPATAPTSLGGARTTVRAINLGRRNIFHLLLIDRPAEIEVVFGHFVSRMQELHDRGVGGKLTQKRLDGWHKTAVTLRLGEKYRRRPVAGILEVIDFAFDAGLFGPAMDPDQDRWTRLWHIHENFDFLLADMQRTGVLSAHPGPTHQGGDFA